MLWTEVLHILSQSWFKRHGTESCPHCRTEKGARPLLHVLEKGMRSEIESFKIHCSQHHQGCEWTGELRELDKHVKSDIGCGYYDLICPNKCKSTEENTTILLRKDLKEHLKGHCDLRLEKCQYCPHIGM